eukprot:CAMPEP_0167811446 /NCGR_PEP_ID=MMETSP0112_2-20121227/678_1 /TAXON_ID=91324 /ORGANISM="Lotharella globosa, Strain CCCM811" /LENGTH=41 /DNA_ID= /DNA_START= /DNA_END= /DNA_ORIENTATION=
MANQRGNDESSNVRHVLKVHSFRLGSRTQSGFARPGSESPA